jgi:Na+-translocating ferredoxin:NAD+ oxidoreductase subunit C
MTNVTLKRDIKINMSKIFKFKGGVHPSDNKITSKLAVETLKIPKYVVLPVVQHIGAPANIIVSEGDKVKKGQMIAEANGFVSVPVHASVSGIVFEITEFLHPVIGKPVEAVVIEVDEEQRDFKVDPIKDYTKSNPKDLINRIKDAGVVGLGGASFPTHVKFSPPDDVSIDTLVVNGAECEPYLTSDDRVMQENAKDIIEGIKIALFILKASKAIIGIEDNKEEAIKIIQEACKNEENIEVVILKTYYPQGAEKQLIKATLNREVPCGALPLNVGVVVSNVSTLVAVYNAIVKGENLTDKIVTISGSAINNPKNLKVPIGTLINDIIEECGGVKDDLAQVIMGGPMMGIAQPTVNVPVIKGTSGILFFAGSEVVDKKFSDCFRCGKCTNVCPMGLLPNMISIFSENDKFDNAKRYKVIDCVECGSCVYVCPARRPIVQQVKWAKLNLNKKN